MARPSIPADGRSVAARVVQRVLDDQAFAAAALDAELRRHPQLDARERALATELVYGTLRSSGALLARLGRHARRGNVGNDALVVAHLSVAAYQILCLDRVPAHAAIDRAVGALKVLRGPKVGGFANAVLRKLAAGGERLDLAQAVEQSAPSWLLEALASSLGQEEARAVLGAGASRDGHVVVLRQRLDPALRQAFAATEASWLSTGQPGIWSPLALGFRAEGDPRGRPGWRAGAFVVQEEGAQVLALAVGARPGDRVLDACAGRGQKATLLAEQVAPTGEVWAVDRLPAKLRALDEEATRLGLAPLTTRAVDWTRGVADVPSTFDRVLVDAPCTGTGSLRRRPEIAARLGPDDPRRLAALAESILRSASTRARPGGRVVYAVCSVLVEECERVAQSVRDVLEPAPFDAPEVVELAGGAAEFRLLPGRHGTDGYFVASFVRRG